MSQINVADFKSMLLLIARTEIMTKNKYKVFTENEILDKLEKSSEQAVQGLYEDATTVSCDIRAKYSIKVKDFYDQRKCINGDYDE